MIALLAVSIMGFAFGYFLIGQIADRYSARAYFPLITFVCFLIGFMAFAAVIVQSLITGAEVIELPLLLASLGGWLVYSAAIAAGTSIRVARRTK